MKIHNFVERASVEEIYEKHFGIYSETNFEDFLDSLHYYGVIKKKELEELTDRFSAFEDVLHKSMSKFDKEKLTKL